MHSNVGSLLGIMLVATAGLVSYGQIPKQPTTYTAVTVAGVANVAQGPSALNNLGDIIGRASCSLAAESGATVWSRAGAQMNQLMR